MVRSPARALMLAATLVLAPAYAFAECGIASTYSSGSRTANGEAYNHMGVSAAHKTLPFGTRVVVRNQRTGRSITVRINDRGPFVAGRVIDLSTGAKNALRMDGLAPVCIEVVSYGSGGRIKTRADHYANAQAFVARAHSLGRTAVAIPGRVIQDAAKIGADIVTAPARIIRDISGGHRQIKRRHHGRHRAAQRRHRGCWWCS